MSEELSKIQEKIEDELFKEYDKNLDRSFSLLEFIFVILGFYPLVLSNIYGNLDGNITDNIITRAQIHKLQHVLSIGAL